MIRPTSPTGRAAAARYAIVASRTALLAAAATVLAGCQPLLLDPKGPIGAANRTILIDSLAIMLAIVVPTIIAVFAFAWWFRASNTKAKHRPDWEFSGQIELVVWSIPTMTIILLGGVTWIGAHQLDPSVPIDSKTPALDIQVVSLDWKWLFIFPEQRVASINELVVPVNTPLHFSLSSSSVMNTFFIPQLGSMIYTMNGMTTQLNLQADEPGVYHGLSGHYSGEGFADMHFDVHAVSSTEFAAWVNRTRDSSKTLDAAAYNALARQSINLPPSTYGNVDRDLFARIVSQDLPPGPGPGVEREGAAAKPEIKS